MIAPEVVMCPDQDCGGPPECDHIRYDRRTMGSIVAVPAGTDPEGAIALLRQELAIGTASDSNGACHMIPAGARFIAHKATHRNADGLHELYRAVYDGETDLDELLADSPEWSDERMQQRLALLKAG